MDTGGSAFPETDSDVTGRGEEAIVEVYSYGGMTLLDYFAGKALTGLVQNWSIPCGQCKAMENAASTAYAMAEAMIKVKQRLESQPKKG